MTSTIFRLPDSTARQPGPTPSESLGAQVLATLLDSVLPDASPWGSPASGYLRDHRRDGPVGPAL